MIRSVWLALPVALALGCGKTPIRHYQLQPLLGEVEPTKVQKVPLTLSVQGFSSDAAYDDRRIVYRESDVRLDYYHFHRWAAEPGQMVSMALRELYRKSGLFAAVVGDYSAKTDVVLSGRIVALEEVDESKTSWKARIVLELSLRNNRTGKLIWTDLASATEPLQEQNPAALARAMSRAVTRIGKDTAPRVAHHASTALSDPITAE